MASYALEIMIEFYPYKDVNKYTWVQHIRQLQRSIDYFIQQQNIRVKANDVGMYRGVLCGSDYFLVVAKIIVHYSACKFLRRDVKTGNKDTKAAANIYK